MIVNGTARFVNCLMGTLTGNVIGNVSGSASYATSSDTANYINLVATNEIRFYKNQFKGGTVHFGYRWSDGSTSPLITEYRFNNGNGSPTQVTASQFNGNLNGIATRTTLLNPVTTSDTFTTGTSSRFLNKVYFSNGGTFNGNLNVNNIISSTIGGQTWTSGSKIKLMGRINTSVLGVVNGTMARQLNTTTAKTAYITLNFATTNDCAGIEQGKTYSGSAIGDLKMMMYEVNLNVNGTTKNRPVGIRMSSYNEDKKSSIDIYNGTVDDGKPIVRMGYLGGLPAVNGENPTGYGFYAVGNAFFSGRIVSGSGKIGNWNIGTDSLYIPNGTGISSNTNKWAFWAGESNNKNGASDTNAVFRVGHNGVLIATNAAITGSITATSGAIGSFTLDSTYLQSSDKTVGLSATASDWAFWAGGTSMSTAKFRVNHAGTLYATGANISGNITATSGTIGGCSISNGTLIVPSANISGTLNASQIRIGDFTEYHDLTSETYSRYGFSIVADGNNNPYLSSIFWCKNNMILAFPFSMS